MRAIIQSCKSDWMTVKTVIAREKLNIESIQNNDSINKLVNFLITGEDHRFNYHFGFDGIAILRAMKNRLLFNKKEGASTIEQQLVRTITCDFEKVYLRKIKEIILAFYLKTILDKRSIALIYLNIAYYGTDYGNLDKILYRFNKRKGDVLDNETCAEIISRLKYPEPKTRVQEKLDLIARRKCHLLRLYDKHSNYKLIKIHG